MDVVINACFGGFGLSPKAETLYAKKKGFEIFHYKQTKYQHRDGVKEYTLIATDAVDLFTYTLTKNAGKKIPELPMDAWWYSRDIERHDPVLVEVVNELGPEKASGECARLRVVTIPDGVEYEIHEYDGNESIHEFHRSWS